MFTLLNREEHIQRINNHQDAYKQLITNGTLKKDDYLAIQKDVTTIRRKALVGIMDLYNAGLTFQADIKDQIISRQNRSGFGSAKLEMNPTKTTNNQVDYTLDIQPLPIGHMGWGIPFRQKQLAYKYADGFEESVRKTSEAFEGLLFNGAPTINVKYGDSTVPVYGYMTHPSASSHTITDWASVDGGGAYDNLDGIVPDVIAMRAKAFTEGSVSGNSQMVLYVNNAYWGVLDNDYKAYATRTILERILQISNISAVKPTDELATGQVCLVEMDKRTIELGVAQDIITVPQNMNDIMQGENFLTYGCMTPMIHADREGKTGIVKGVQA